MTAVLCFSLWASSSFHQHQLAANSPYYMQEMAHGYLHIAYLSEKIWSMYRIALCEIWGLQGSVVCNAWRQLMRPRFPERLLLQVMWPHWATVIHHRNTEGYQYTSPNFFLTGCYLVSRNGHLSPVIAPAVPNCRVLLNCSPGRKKGLKSLWLAKACIRSGRW